MARLPTLAMAWGDALGIGVAITVIVKLRLFILTLALTLALALAAASAFARVAALTPAGPEVCSGRISTQ